VEVGAGGFLVGQPGVNSKFQSLSGQDCEILSQSPAALNKNILKIINWLKSNSQGIGIKKKHYEHLHE
jgi:hypothetical protein